MKGQLLSADFVVGMALLALSIGLLVNAAETSQRSSSPFLYSSDAQTISLSLLSNVSLPLSATNYCYSFGNGSSTCNAFSCAGNTLVSHRFIPCVNGPFSTNYCFMEVRVCN